MDKSAKKRKNDITALDVALRLIITADEYRASEEKVRDVMAFAMFLEDEINDPMTVDFIKLMIEEDMAYNRPMLPSHLDWDSLRGNTDGTV